MVGWHHRLNRHGFRWTPGVGDGQGGLACCSSWAFLLLSSVPTTLTPHHPIERKKKKNSHSVMSNSLQPHGLQHARPSCPSPTPRVYSNSCSLRRRHWHPTPVLLPGESHGRGSLVGFHLWDHIESDTTETT